MRESGEGGSWGGGAVKSLSALTLHSTFPTPANAAVLCTVLCESEEEGRRGGGR